MEAEIDKPADTMTYKSRSDCKSVEPLPRCAGSPARRRVGARTLYGILIGILGSMACPRAGAQAVTLTLGVTSLHFPNASPVATASIPASENPMSVLVGFTGIGHWALSITANGDLMAGSATIPVSNVSWTASGVGFVGGTMSKTTPQPLSGGALALPSALGQISFFLLNSWSYATGMYTQSFTITLSSF